MKEKDEFELSVEMGGWQECAPEFARYYSAVLYFFASRLQEELTGYGMWLRPGQKATQS